MVMTGDRLMQLRALLGAAGGVAPGAAKTTWRAGQLAQGNIDLHNRPVVHNPDGSISTVRSITTTGDNDVATLLPTVSPQGTILSNPDAVALWRATGQNLGTFQNEDIADKYAQDLHRAQAQEYGAPPANPFHMMVAPGGTPSGAALDEGGVPILKPWEIIAMNRQRIDRSLAPDRSLALGRTVGSAPRHKGHQ